MTSLLVATVVFGCVFGGAVLGILLQAKLPDQHRDTASKEAVRLVMGLIATMAALVLSLLIASTHTFYVTQQEEVQKLAADIVLLDESLARYVRRRGRFGRSCARTSPRRCGRCRRTKGSAPPA